MTIVPDGYYPNYHTYTYPSAVTITQPLAGVWVTYTEDHKGRRIVSIHKDEVSALREALEDGDLSVVFLRWGESLGDIE